jgi:hypothetical protein
MTLPQAIEILSKYNDWRRVAETSQIEPKIIGIAIDTIIKFYTHDQN